MFIQSKPRFTPSMAALYSDQTYGLVGENLWFGPRKAFSW